MPGALVTGATRILGREMLIALGKDTQTLLNSLCIVAKQLPGKRTEI